MFLYNKHILTKNFKKIKNILKGCEIMAVLTNDNLKNFKEALDDLEKHTKNWDKCLTDASNALNKSVGKTFRAEYEMGKNATEKMQTVLGLLKTLQGDLSTLVVTAEVYYDDCVTAAKRAASKTSSSSKKTTSSTSKKTTTTAKAKTSTNTTSTKNK